MNPITFMPWMPDAGWYTLAAVFLAVACGLFFLGFFRDRARGRARCPKCWYALQGLETDLPRPCPECGRVITHRRQLYRTRWHGVPVAFGVLALVLAIAAYFTPPIRRDGWLQTTPTWALRLHLAWSSRESIMQGDPVVNEIIRRLEDGEIRDSDSCQAALMSIRHALFSYREKWPTGVPVAVDGLAVFFDQDPRNRDEIKHVWFGISGLQTQGRFSSRALARETAENWWSDEATTSITPRVVKNRASINVIVIIPGPFVPITGDAAVGIDPTSPAPLYVPLHLPITLVDRADQCIEPITSPEIDAAVQTLLQPRLRRSAFSPVAGVRFTISSRPPSLEDIAVGVRIELLYKDQVMATTRYRDNSGRVLTDLYSLPARLDASPQLVERLFAESENPDWTVRFTGDAALSLRDLKRSKYWSGSYTILLRDLFPPSKADDAKLPQIPDVPPDPPDDEGT